MLKELHSTDTLNINPINFEFVGEDAIVVYLNDKTAIYDTDLNFLFSIPVYFNGVKGLVKKLPNGWYKMFDKFYDTKGALLDKKLHYSIKTIEKYINRDIFIDNSGQYIIAGCAKGGKILLYDLDVKPVHEIEVEKYEALVAYNPSSNLLYTFDEKEGLLKIYLYANYALVGAHKVHKQNSKFLVSNAGSTVFNYGYNPQNTMIDLDGRSTRKVFFHPTNVKGYKEQYLGPNNFGTGYVVADEEFKYFIACTHQNKGLIYNGTKDTVLDLRLYDVFAFDQFNHPLGKYFLYNAFFQHKRVVANIGHFLTTWTYEGELIEKQEGIGPVKVHHSGRVFSLVNQQLKEVEVL